MYDTVSIEQVDELFTHIIDSHQGFGKLPSLGKMRQYFLYSSSTDPQALTHYELTLGFAYAFKRSGLGFWLDWKEKEGLSETSRIIQEERQKVLKKHGTPVFTGSQFGWYGNVMEEHEVPVGLAVFDRWLAQNSGDAVGGVPTLRLVDARTSGDFYAAVMVGEDAVDRVIELFNALDVKATLATELHPGNEVTAKHLDPGWLDKMFDLQELAGSVLVDAHGFDSGTAEPGDARWLRDDALQIWQRPIADGVLLKVAIQPTRAPNPNGQVTQVSPIVVVERDDLNHVWAEITAGANPGNGQTVTDRTDTRYTLHRYNDYLRDAEGFYHKDSLREERMQTEAAWFEKRFGKVIKAAKSTSYAKRRLTKTSKAFQKKQPGGWIDVDGVLLALLTGSWGEAVNQQFLGQGDALVAAGEAEPWMSEWIDGIRTWAKSHPEGLADWQ